MREKRLIASCSCGKVEIEASACDTDERDAEYKTSAEYTRLAPSTIKAYTAYIKLIENDFGDLQLAALKDPRMRGDVLHAR